MENINKLIDHTLLKPDASAEQIKRICAEAREYGFMSVCVNPARVKLVLRHRLPSRRNAQCGESV